MGNEVGLEWVLHDGGAIPVSAFASLRPRDRPAVACPECGGRVTLKLGRIRRHHAAHAADAQCVAIQPETALHINTKLYLAQALTTAIGSGKALMRRRSCLVGDPRYRDFDDSYSRAPCTQKIIEPWVPEWDSVRVELGVHHNDTRRVPDIVLKKGREIVGAIEVLVTHEVDAAKAAALAELGVPWIEIRASESLYAGPRAWTINDAMDVEQIGPHAPWRCEHHEQLVAMRADERQRRHVRESSPPRTSEASGSARLISARIVDVYLPGGTWRRVVYHVNQFLVGGKVERVELARDDRVVEIVKSKTGEDVDAVAARARVSINTAYEQDLLTLTRTRGSFTDSPMRWAAGLRAKDVLPESPRFPRRFFYQASEAKWVLGEGLEGIRWPVDATAAADITRGLRLKAIEAATRGKGTPGSFRRPKAR